MSSPKNVIKLFLVAHEELLDALDLLLQLDCDLVHLCTLHVVVIYLVSPDGVVETILLIAHDHLVLNVMSLGKLIDHELLHRHNVDYVHLGLDVVKDENAHLVGDRAVVEVLDHKQHGRHYLSTKLLWHVRAQLELFYMDGVWVWKVFSQKLGGCEGSV